MFEVLVNEWYDSGRANQTTCKGYASNINKGNGLESFDFSQSYSLEDIALD